MCRASVDAAIIAHRLVARCFLDRTSRRMAAGIVREVRPMVAESKLVRVQDRGQVTLPAEVRKRLGLKKGDLVVVRETAEGVLLTPQVAAITDALDRLGAILREDGITLDELIESGRA